MNTGIKKQSCLSAITIGVFSHSLSFNPKRVNFDSLPDGKSIPILLSKRKFLIFLYVVFEAV